MATSNDTELKEYVVNYVESDELADELAESGAFEEGQFVYTPDSEDELNELEKNFDLLWQNPNPTVTQTAQNILVANLSQYNTFVIKVQRAIDHTLVYNYSNHAITPEDNICFNTIGVFGYTSYCRNVYVNLSSGELVINNGYVQSAIGSGAVNNDKLIVTHLYGLKTRLYTKLEELPDAELSETSENAVQNKAVTKAINGTILWSGASNGNITLIDNVNNYKYVKIYYAGDTGQTTGESSKKITAQNYYGLHLEVVEMDSSNSGNYGYVLKQNKYNLVDNTLTVVASCRMYKYQSDSIVQMDQKNQVVIRKIIGYK